MDRAVLVYTLVNFVICTLIIASMYVLRNGQ